MNPPACLFVDRDGTLVEEPGDQQVDALEKIRLVPGAIPALGRLSRAGYRLVMVSNQDGLGTERFPREKFERAHDFIMALFGSQGVHFDKELICPHSEQDRCHCRKPGTGLVSAYLARGAIDRGRSFVIGDRDSDMALAQAMGITGLKIGDDLDWPAIEKRILKASRTAEVRRQTRETDACARVSLDSDERASIDTGIGFFDHMLEQVAQHAGIGVWLTCRGDLHVDEHHTVEDSALVLGQAIREAMGDKRGIRRYGFVVPMDEARAQLAIDLGGRPYSVFEGKFTRETVGGLPTELVPHFFRSLAESLGAAIHVELRGENNHHMIEAAFKGLGRCLRQALCRDHGEWVPSTKGVL